MDSARRSRNWTRFSSPWARAWGGHDVVDLAVGRLVLHYAGENPDEVAAALDDKTEAFICELEARHKEVRRSAPPIFAATSANDTTVYPSSKTVLVARLRAAGANVEEKTYPDTSRAGIVLALSPPFRGEAPVLEDVMRFFRGIEGAAEDGGLALSLRAERSNPGVVTVAGAPLSCSLSALISLLAAAQF